MFYNKYGIIIKKTLKEKYYDKYIILLNENKLNEVIAQTQSEVVNYKKDLLERIKKPLFKERLILIQNKVSQKINSIVDDIVKNI